MPAIGARVICPRSTRFALQHIARAFAAPVRRRPHAPRLSPVLVPHAVPAFIFCVGVGVRVQSAKFRVFLPDYKISNTNYSFTFEENAQKETTFQFLFTCYDFVVAFLETHVAVENGN